MKQLAYAPILIALWVTVTAMATAEPSASQDRLFESMLGSYVVLQAADVYLTHRGTQLGLSEENPVFTSTDSVMAAKVALVPLTAWGLTRLRRTHPKLATGLAIGLNALYVGVAYNNLRVINEAD